jgi:hypothetical protein
VPTVSTQERRLRKRYQKSLEVEFYTNGRIYRGVSDDFSISGLFIKTDNGLALESVVSMKVHLPDGSVSLLRGRVRRVNKMSYALVATSEKTLKKGMGIEIIERDSNYMKFFMSLLNDSQNRNF